MIPAAGSPGAGQTGAGLTASQVTGKPFVIREVSDPWAFRALERVQVSAWGYTDREVTPGTLFRISAVTGGIVLGAYAITAPDDPAGLVPVGLAFGFPAVGGERVWHHSHLLAVHPEWRGTGMAVALKLEQRRLALRQGMTMMTWTFDPLIARNARLNLGKLGARATSYHPDWYALEDDRITAFPADRLMVEWDLTAMHAERPAPPPRGQMALEAQSNAVGLGGLGPGIPRLYLAGGRVLAEVPTRLDGLDDATRRSWRMALRDVLGTYLSRGYVVSDLARDGTRAYYVLSRD